MISRSISEVAGVPMVSPVRNGSAPTGRTYAGNADDRKYHVARLWTLLRKGSL